jgi:hypothetical protein
MDDEEVAASPWFVLAEALEECWPCGSSTRVFAVLLPDLHSEAGETTTAGNCAFDYAPCSLTNMTSVNIEAEAYLGQIAINFYPDHSGTAGHSYWMNHCERCSSKIGDFYLHSKLGHAFFPASEEEVSRIRLKRVNTEIRAEAGWGQSSWIDEILEKANL